MAETKLKASMKPRKIRFKPDEEARIQMLADLYAGGNFSKWIRWAAVNCNRKVLVEIEDP